MNLASSWSMTAVTTVGLAALLASNASQATSIDIDAFASGSYYFAEQFAGFPESGKHCNDIFCDTHSAYFAFDLAGVGEPVTAATLQLELTAWDSLDASEVFNLYDVLTPVVGFPHSLLSPVDTSAVDIDLSSGAIYGSALVTPSDVGMVLEIVLTDAAIADINAAAGDLFAIGLQVQPPYTCQDFETPNCREFIDFTSQTGLPPVQRLSLVTETPVPEPGAAALFGLGIVMVRGAVRRRSP